MSDDYNLIDVNKYSNKELLEDNLVITKAMSIEKCITKEELKKNLMEIIDNIEGEEHLNKVERMIKIILKKSLGDEETNNMLERIHDKKKGLYRMLAVLERLEMQEKKIREEYREKGIKEGKKEGKREGMKEGINKAKIKIAKEMLKENIDINKVCKCTKLNKDEIQKIQKEFKQIES